LSFHEAVTFKGIVYILSLSPGLSTFL